MAGSIAHYQVSCQCTILIRRMAIAAAETKPSTARRNASLLYAVKRVELVVRSHLDELLRPSGVTALQYTALTVLERHDGLPAAQLARRSFVTAQSMADMVRALERRGLIVRERNPENRRELLIRLTDAGRKLLAEHTDEVLALESRMVSQLTERQVEQFRAALAEAWHALS
jgi:DNA-binding MarR family transcriptional regulator